MQQEQFTLPKGVTVRSPRGAHYIIEGLLGKGKMGAVYLVRDRRSQGSLFALKEVINPNQQDRERFAFEARVLSRLKHQALPRVYHVFENHKLKRVYILMDYIKGRNLEELRQDEPDARFSLPIVMVLMAPIVDALNYLHQQSPPIIHRDIKPANVIIPVNADKAMLVDFGSAKEYTLNRGVTVFARYSPGYAAPEQYGSGTNPRTDIYGLGATIYTLLTGVIPIDAPSRVSRNWDQRSDSLKPAELVNPTIPTVVSHALQRAMSISSADRFETVAEFWQALRIQTVSSEVHIPRVTAENASQPFFEEDTGQPQSSYARRRPLFVRYPSVNQILLLLILLILLVFIVFGLLMLIRL